MAIAPSDVASHKATTSEVDTTHLTRSAWALSLGSALEYYDFALYSLASALIFGPLFFPSSSIAMQLILSFGTYFLGFAVRPIGGVVFGALGDRIGRKAVLTITVLLMGVSSTLIGLLPTYHSVGYLAPILLVILRIGQGLGAGAEQAGAAVMMTESAPRNRRGFFASLPFVGVQGGTILAALVYFLMLYGVEDIADTWLWRIPFLCSAAIVGVALYMRLHMKESPTFEKLSAENKRPKSTLKESLACSKKSILTGIGLRMAENGGSSIYQALAISYIAGVVGLRGPVGALTLVVAASVGVVTVLVAGKASDIYGRRAVYRFFAVFQLVVSFPVWYVLSQGELISTIIAITIALGIGTWGMFGAQGALLPELFGSRYRYLGVSISREISAVIAGGIAPLVGALLMGATEWVLGGNPETRIYAWIPIATYLSLLTLITVITAWRMPESLNRDLNSEDDAH